MSDPDNPVERRYTMAEARDLAFQAERDRAARTGPPYDVVQPGTGPHQAVSHSGTRLTATWDPDFDVWIVVRDISDRSRPNPMTAATPEVLSAVEFRSYPGHDVWLFTDTIRNVYQSSRLSERTI